ncbi:3-oxoacyl-ACP synthase [Flavivirga rizhaonensis]|uniref:3-oxoacyl-ACP synthase n=1 Tax=Flavivirga rizhaonensis TaxID=2559571 RepID=A0A4S1DVV6_9FLAO|nr:3-oxoacyl-ACP synthase [Flavivirga rizhaonensis]TGV02237.1 3-oxoacyl-ACP synthase [Flavivirga rizhaonensis]
MNSKYHITSFCNIKNNTVSLNGSVIYNDENNDFLEFIKAAYKSFETDYAKFFKMDALSKLAFLAADVLLKNEDLNQEEENNIAIVFSNKASSIDTDRKHQKSIQDKEDYFPSPAVFVYTLPNICIGEISIKYKLFSENSFFIFDAFNAQHLFDYTNSLLATDKTEKVLCGWVELDGDHYEAFLYLVTKKGLTTHNKQNILKLYNT